MKGLAFIGLVIHIWAAVPTETLSPTLSRAAAEYSAIGVPLVFTIRPIRPAVLRRHPPSPRLGFFLLSYAERYHYAGRVDMVVTPPEPYTDGAIPTQYGFAYEGCGGVGVVGLGGNVERDAFAFMHELGHALNADHDAAWSCTVMDTYLLSCPIPTLFSDASKAAITKCGASLARRPRR